MRILYKLLLFLLLISSLIYGISNIPKGIEDGKNQPPIAPIPDKTRYELLLYFGSSNNNYLAGERRVIISAEQLEEKIIIEELIKGPRNKFLHPTIPSDTLLLSIKTENNICYVNLSNRFLDYSKAEKMNKLSVWSIVNSLTELSHVDSVQILVEGNKEDLLEKKIDTGEPLRRNEELMVSEVRTAFVIFNEFLEALKVSNYQKAYEMLSKESIENNDFVKFKLMTGNYVRGLREYDIFRYQTQKFSSGVTLIIRFRKKPTSMADIEEDIIEQWDFVNENGLWKIILPAIL